MKKVSHNTPKVKAIHKDDATPNLQSGLQKAERPMGVEHRSFVKCPCCLLSSRKE